MSVPSNTICKHCNGSMKDRVEAADREEERTPSVQIAGALESAESSATAVAGDESYLGLPPTS